MSYFNSSWKEQISFQVCTKISSTQKSCLQTLDQEVCNKAIYNLNAKCASLTLYLGKQFHHSYTNCSSITIQHLRIACPELPCKARSVVHYDYFAFRNNLVGIH